MTAVIYARYSTDSQREESIEGQIRECTAYAEKNGFAWLDMGARFLGGDGEIKPGLMMPDKLHPVRAGYEIWLDALGPLVDRLLER